MGENDDTCDQSENCTLWTGNINMVWCRLTPSLFILTWSQVLIITNDWFNETDRNFWHDNVSSLMVHGRFEFSLPAVSTILGIGTNIMCLHASVIKLGG